LSDRNERNQVFTGGSQPGVMSRDVMKDDFGFEIPVESIPLPSKGVAYPPDSPLHLRETVDVRAMTAREEDILTSRALIKKGTVITELIKSCLVDKRIDVSQMLSGDRNALMVALRVTGYGADYVVEVDCPACSTKSKQTFNLSDLELKPLNLEPVEVGQNVFETVLPVTKKKVRFKFLTGSDEEEILAIQERKKKMGAMGDNVVTTRLQFSIVAIEGKTDKALIGSFIRSMPARDSLHLRNFIEKSEPGIDMTSHMDCPSCSEVSEVRIPLGVTFFWPSAG
jgi:hypothetical protein